MRSTRTVPDTQGALMKCVANMMDYWLTLYASDETLLGFYSALAT